MKLIHINESNQTLLNEFIQKNNSKFFRYYDKRDINIIKNHIFTVILKNNEDNIVGYAHIDHENDTYWTALCVLSDYQNKGYGKYLMKNLHNFAVGESIETLHLSVDIDNMIAMNLYLKQGYHIINITQKYYVMKKSLDSTTIEVPVSFGDCIDKLSILEIKKQFIKDQTKQKHICKEFSCLYEKVKTNIIEVDYHYKLLININKKIWIMQDLFRDSVNKDQKQKLCLDIIDYNDRRFRIKNKINYSTNSMLKEVKGYNAKRCFILGHLGMGDHLTAVGFVRYLSSLYDEITVVCKNKNRNNLIEIYSDDDTIEILSVENDRDISPKYGCSLNEFKKITEGKDLFMMGYHNISHPSFDANNMPFCFYHQMNIPASHMWEYFHVQNTEKALSLYETVKSKKYIFVHNTSSNGVVFSINDIKHIFNENHSSMDMNDYILINPNKNMYDDGNHPHYEIAESLKGYSILSYKMLIENSDFIFVSDSSFFCLSFQLMIKSDYNYLIQRSSTKYANYDHIWSDKYKYKNYGRKRFIQFVP